MHTKTTMSEFVHKALINHCSIGPKELAYSKLKPKAEIVKSALCRVGSSSSLSSYKSEIHVLKPYTSGSET